ASTSWSTGARQFVSRDGRVTYALLELAGNSAAARIKSVGALQADITASGLTVLAGGQIPTEAAINKEVTSDIGRAETISMPLLLILLLVIFGRLAAAGL